jgi:ketosteroid isomerase-like protein
VILNTDGTVSRGGGSVGLMRNNEERMSTWCRMWNEDAALAHELMTDGCVQWSGQTAGLDTVIGPQQQEQFIARYRAQHINVFVPRVLVDGGGRFGYLWDVTLPDGTVLTGADVNILRANKIDENWTFVGERHCDHPDPDPGAQQRTDATAVEELCQRWIQLWDDNITALNDLVTDDFEIFLGAKAAQADDVRGPSALARHVENRRTAEAPLVVTAHREPVIDVARGRAAVLRTDRVGSSETGGLDLLTVRDGRIAQAWSLKGSRPFRY